VLFIAAATATAANDDDDGLGSIVSEISWLWWSATDAELYSSFWREKGDTDFIRRKIAR